jgi:hypothetical protein
MYIPDSLIEHWANLGNEALSALPTSVPFVLHSGDSLSDVVQIPAGQRAIAFTLPTNWEDSALTFQASADGSTFWEITNAYPGLDFLTLTGAKAGMLIYAPTWNSARLPYLKVRSGTLAEGLRWHNVHGRTAAASD